MRFLLHGTTLAPSVSHALSRHGHHPSTMADLSLAATTPAPKLLDTVRTKQLDIVTTDSKLIDHIYAADLWFNRVIVYLQLSGQDVEQDDAIDRLFKRYKRLTPGRLYTVTESRVKIRQLPSKNKFAIPPKADKSAFRELPDEDGEVESEPDDSE
jgi:propanediol dehydratase small subunit